MQDGVAFDAVRFALALAELLLHCGQLLLLLFDFLVQQLVLVLQKLYLC